VTGHKPLWRTPTRREAIDILVSGRTEVDHRVARLDGSQLSVRTKVGAWSVKDLVGHLASCEEFALAVAIGKRPRHGAAAVDERNGLEVKRKQRWSVQRVLDDAREVRSDLLAAINGMDDEAWKAKIQVGGGKSSRGLVLGRLLVGGRFGLFAHDREHLRDLDTSVKSLMGEAQTKATR